MSIKNMIFDYKITATDIIFNPIIRILMEAVYETDETEYENMWDSIKIQSPVNIPYYSTDKATVENEITDNQIADIIENSLKNAVKNKLNNVGNITHHHTTLYTINFNPFVCKFMQKAKTEHEMSNEQNIDIYQNIKENISNCTTFDIVAFTTEKLSITLRNKSIKDAKEKIESTIYSAIMQTIITDTMKKDFEQAKTVKENDIIFVNDMYDHDGTTHMLLVESIETDEETNCPIFYGTDILYPEDDDYAILSARVNEFKGIANETDILKAVTSEASNIIASLMEYIKNNDKSRDNFSNEEEWLDNLYETINTSEYMMKTLNIKK